MTVWPLSLPQAPLAERYQETLPNAILRSEMDQGPAKLRARTSAAVGLFRLSYILTRAQAETLETFYRATLGQGALAFGFPHPRTGVAGSFRFRAPPDILAVNGLYFRVDLQLEALP